MRQRIITASILLAVVGLGFAFQPLGWIPLLLLIVFGVICVGELAKMYRQEGMHIARRVAMVLVGVMGLAAWMGRMDLVPHLIGVGVGLAFFWRMRAGEIVGSWRDVAATIAAGVYVGLPVAMMIELFTAGRAGRGWLLIMLLIIWATDSMALFAGKNFGTVKIFPRISPGKTWQGSIGGVFGSMLPAFVARGCFPRIFNEVGDIELVAVCLVTGVLTQTGDLAESLLKRDAGVKDSGNWLAGHGGALDRLDSILFVTVPFSLYLRVMHPDVFGG